MFKSRGVSYSGVSWKEPSWVWWSKSHSTAEEIASGSMYKKFSQSWNTPAYNDCTTCEVNLEIKGRREYKISKLVQLLTKHAGNLGKRKTEGNYAPNTGCTIHPHAKWSILVTIVHDGSIVNIHVLKNFLCSRHLQLIGETKIMKGPEIWAKIIDRGVSTQPMIDWECSFYIHWNLWECWGNNITW